MYEKTLYRSIMRPSFGGWNGHAESVHASGHCSHYSDSLSRVHIDRIIFALRFSRSIEHCRKIRSRIPVLYICIVYSMIASSTNLLRIGSTHIYSFWISPVPRWYRIHQYGPTNHFYIRYYRNPSPAGGILIATSSEAVTKYVTLYWLVCGWLFS